MIQRRESVVGENRTGTRYEDGPGTIFLKDSKKNRLRNVTALKAYTRM